MDNQELIKSLYKILLLFEDTLDEKSNVTITEYLTYLDRTATRFLGNGNEEIYQIIRGLIKLADNVNHKQVKSMVFHMIKLIGGNSYAS